MMVTPRGIIVLGCLGLASALPISCTSSHEAPKAATMKEISHSGGWTLLANGWEGRVVSPNGVSTNVEMIDSPEFAPCFLWRILEPETHNLWIVLYSPPLASGSTVMKVYSVSHNTRLELQEEIWHHFEFDAVSGTDDDQQVQMVDQKQFKLSRLIFSRSSDPEMQKIASNWITRSTKPNRPSP